MNKKQLVENKIRNMVREYISKGEAPKNWIGTTIHIPKKNITGTVTKVLGGNIYINHKGKEVRVDYKKDDIEIIEESNMNKKQLIEKYIRKIVKEEISKINEVKDSDFAVVGISKSGYWTVMSGAFSNTKEAKDFMKMLTPTKGETNAIKTVGDINSHKKVVGREYLK